MKKTLIASAIAAVAFSGGVMAQAQVEPVSEDMADILAQRIDSLPQVFGNIQLAVRHSDIDGSSELEHFDNGTTLGVKHSHELAPGIEGFFHLELEGIGADAKSTSSGIDSLDEAYIGVRGESFGKLWVGSDDSTYERLIDRMANTWEWGGQNEFAPIDTGEGDLIQYSSPSFSGLVLHAAVQINGDDDDRTGGEKSYPYQLGVSYEMGGLELAAAMDSNDGNTGYSRRLAPDVAEENQNSELLSPNNNNTYGVLASYTMGELNLLGQFQTRDDTKDVTSLMASYSMGPNVFRLGYEYADYDAEIDVDDVNNADIVTAQVLHNLSDNMYVWVEGYMGDRSGAANDREDLVVGAVYYF